jgi:hypothetical protein
MSKYGEYRRPVLLLEAYKDWYADRIGGLQEGSVELREAASKADFPEFLFGPIRTSVYQGYTRVTPQYRRYARIENATDFRERRIKGLWGLTGIGYVGDHGEYPEMQRTERPSATLVIDTYGAVYAITRQTIINDESGDLLSKNPDDMGYAAAQFVTEAIIAYIEGNPTAPDGNPVFSEARGNQITSPLSEDSLASAISTMEIQRDGDGRRIVVRPQVLAVQSVRMELIANRILRSQETGTNAAYTGAAGAGSNVFDKGTINPLAGILPQGAVVRDPYWSDANDWYLFANPSDVPAFAVGFLGGREEPQVFKKNSETSSALSGPDPYTWELDSVDFKVRLDFGVGNVDPAGAFRSVVA